jgi:hypothetical protein
MTVPKCKGRKVRQSTVYNYNLTGLTSRAMGKIFARNQKREIRLAKRQRARERNDVSKARTKLTPAERDLARGYRLETRSVEWVSADSITTAEIDTKKLKAIKQKTRGYGYLNPVTGATLWGEKMEPDGSISLRNIIPMEKPLPMTCHHWESVYPLADIKPVCQKLGGHSPENDN